MEAAGELVELGPGARIYGQLRYQSVNELKRAPGAGVQGEVDRLEPSRASRGNFDRIREGAAAIGAAMLAMLVILLLAWLPWIGGVVAFAALLPGMGGLLLQFGVRRTERRTSPGGGRSSQIRNWLAFRGRGLG